MSNGTSPTPQMDALAKELARVFDIDWSGSGAVSATHKGRRFQLIYRSDVGGDHYNHVHFGIRDERSAAERKRAETEEKRDQTLSSEDLNNKYGWGQ